MSIKILYYGGQKSGKSALAEKRALELGSARKCYYIATYDNSYSDSEMRNRIKKHIKSRGDSFITIEEPKEIDRVIQKDGVYLIDCLSMWILNTLDEDIDRLYKRLDAIFNKSASVVFVLNSVDSGVIPIDKISRKYVDRSGLIGQYVAKYSNEVYEVKLGMEFRLK